MTKTETSISCPVCRSSSEVIRALPQAFIRAALAEYYNSNPPADLGLCDYQLRRCAACRLEFAWPMEPGSSQFYEYVTSQPDYFPQERWEWDVVVDRINSFASGGLLLEVGCGSGIFLDRAARKTKLRCIGLDLTRGVVDGCRAKGLEVYQGKVEDWGHGEFADFEKADVAVAFHCLEHVDDPHGVVKAMANTLKPTGRLIVSTPYSPMAFEDMWFDPLNHPPHHMTRWNTSAYTRLAEQMGLKARFFMPPAAGLASRVLASVTMASGRAAQRKPLQSRLANCVIHPIRLLHAIWKQTTRQRVNGKAAADVILVEMSRADA